MGDDFYKQSHVLNMPFEAYDGDGPYIFISYKHVDWMKVYPIIRRFKKEGFNIWYDANLPQGENYDIEIANRIENSDLFITFITEEVIRCSNNREDYLVKELNVAIALEKQRLPIFLDNIKLSGSFLMHYSNIHSIFKYEFGDDEDKFIEACVHAFKNQFNIPSTLIDGPVSGKEYSEPVGEIKEKIPIAPPEPQIDKEFMCSDKIGTVKKVSTVASVEDGYYLGDLIYRNDSIYLNEDISLNKTINVKKDLTIDGNGHTIDANNKSRIFNIEEGKTVILKNIIFKNAKASKARFGWDKGYGGAIRNSGRLELYNCEFIGNNAENGNDISNGSELKIVNCKFSQYSNGRNSILNVGSIEICDCQKNELEPLISGGSINHIK